MKTMSELRRWLESAPPGTTLTVESLHELLGEVELDPVVQPVPDQSPQTWRVLLWTVDAETRIGKAELLESVNRSPSWLYRHTGPKAVDLIPHRRIEGQLVFVVGEVRHWLRDRETIIAAAPVDQMRVMR